MRFPTIILFVFIFPSLGAFSQPKGSQIDYGFFIGGSYYIGDLNPNKHFNRFSKPAGGLLVRYNFSDRAALRCSFLAGTIEAHDAYGNSSWQKTRNLDFRSQIRELSVQFEFNFLNYKIGGNQSQNNAPYIFVGIAGFHFDPEGQNGNGWEKLQPLGTEGQGLPGGPSKKKYKLFQPSIPFGVGFKTSFSRGMCIGFEWGMRKTFTDYLDDVSTRYYDPLILRQERGDFGERAVTMADKSNVPSNLSSYSNAGKQRGNPNNKDWYSFFGVTLTMRIEKSSSCAGALKMGGS